MLGPKNIQNGSFGIYKLADDMVYDKACREALSNESELKGEILFSPKQFKPGDLDLSFSNHRMTE